MSVSMPVVSHDVHPCEIVAPGKSTSPAQQREPMTGFAGGSHFPSSTRQHNHFISGATQSHRCLVNSSSPHMQNCFGALHAMSDGSVTGHGGDASVPASREPSDVEHPGRDDHRERTANESQAAHPPLL